MSEINKEGDGQFGGGEQVEQVYDERGEALSEIWHTLNDLYHRELLSLFVEIHKDTNENNQVKIVSEFMNKFCNQVEGSLVDKFIDDLSEVGEVSGTVEFKGKRLSKDVIFDKIVDLDTEINLLAGRTEKISRILTSDEQKEQISDEVIDYLNEFKNKIEELISLMEVTLNLFKINVH